MVWCCGPPQSGPDTFFLKEHEQQKPENKNAFQLHVLDPIIQYALGRVFPYIIVTSIVFFLTFVLAVAILFLLLTNRS